MNNLTYSHKLNRLPGDEIAIALKRLKISGCSDCDSAAVYLNHKGIEWCRNNIPEIVSMIQKNASNQRGFRLLARTKLSTLFLSKLVNGVLR